MNRIKTVTIFMLLVALSVTFMGCNKSETTSSTDTPNVQVPAETAKTTEGAINYSKGDKVTIKIAHVSQSGVPIDVASKQIGDMLAEKTGGRITVKVFAASALGNNTELLEQLQAGTLEMAISSVAFLGAFTETTKLLDLPYLFKSNAAAEEVLDGPVGQKIFTELEKAGFHGLAWTATGWRHLTANKEIHTPADLKGLKIRVMENQMHIDHFNALGASAVPMAFSELYTALQNKTMDCQENPFANINGSRLFEVQKYIIKTGHIYDTSPLLASSQWWGTLSKSDQDLIQSVVSEVLISERRLSTENEMMLEKQLGSNGKNEVITLSSEERAKFREAAQAVYDKYAPKIGVDLISQVDAVNAKY